MYHLFKDNAGIHQLIEVLQKMLTHAPVLFLFFNHGFIQIYFDCSDFFLVLFYE